VPEFRADEEAWWLYVLECQGGVLYTGIAKDVDARFEALRAEQAFKQETRAEKLRWCAAGLEGFVARLARP
jgi:predicted GIY-YIG superfamily endonuclease